MATKEARQRARANWAEKNAITFTCPQCKETHTRPARTGGYKFCSISCSAKSRTGERGATYGFRHSEETKEKMRQAQPVSPRGRSGEKHYNWQGGIAFLNQGFRKRTDYKLWARQVKERDGNVCRNCGFDGKLEAHHIVSFSKLVGTVFEKYILDIRNGTALCRNCHVGRRAL